ncbi:MAG: hypothetical protein KF764_32830 [Labilithrix sp.]|nr:hypothetical protein [Labilithrix sp.]
MTRRIFAGLPLVVLVAACAADADVDDPPDDANETRGADGPAAPAAAVDEAPLLSWSFEPASADCNGWPAFGADAIRASPPRTGAYSCKVCSDGTTARLGLFRDLGAAPAGRYVLSAWVRKRAENAAPPSALARIDAATASGVVVSALAPTVAVREAWERLEATLDLASEASNVRVTVAAEEAAPERCLFIDDVELIRLR